MNLSALCTAGFLLGGCVVQDAHRRPYRQVTVVETPPPVAYVGVSAPQATVSVQFAPPAPRREVISVRPSPRHVWIAGYWAWRGGRNVWVSGRWELPPRNRTAWVQPRWEHRNGNYVFTEGFWR